MLSTNLTAQQQLSGTCLHQVSMFTLVLLVLQGPFTDQNTEVPTKQCWECFNKSVRNKTFLNLLKMSKTERSFCTVLDTEFTNHMTQGLKSLNKLLTKYSKWLVKRSWWKLQLNCKRLPWTILTLLTENFIQMLTFTVGLFIRQWDFQLTCSQYFSWFQDVWGGWHTGVSSWMTQKTKSSDQGNTTLEVTQETMFVSMKDLKQSLTSNAPRQHTPRETWSLMRFKKPSSNDYACFINILVN